MANEAKSGFVWYELITDDLEKATAFYGSVVGWEVRDSGMPGVQYLLFGKGGRDVGGMMSGTSTGQNMATKWVGHIHTGDVDAETKAVVADGGKQWRAPQDIPGVGRFSVVSDSQGAEYLLFQPNHSDAPPQLEPAEVGAVGWRELVTSDWQAAWEFYSRHYGWTKGEAVEMGPMGTYQTFLLGEDGFGGGMMNLPAGAGASMPGPAWMFYFTVDAIEAAARRVEDAGGRVDHGPRQVPGGAWILQGVDSQGARFALTAGK